MTARPLYLRTDPAAPSGARTISGMCTLPYGHEHCDPGPLTVDLASGTLVLAPRSCWCRCHDDDRRRPR